MAHKKRAFLDFDRKVSGTKTPNGVFLAYRFAATDFCIPGETTQGTGTGESFGMGDGFGNACGPSRRMPNCTAGNSMTCDQGVAGIDWGCGRAARAGRRTRTKTVAMRTTVEEAKSR